jgi:hypothetical protein
MVIDREQASLATLRRAICDVREMYPGEPILAVVDYLQIVESERRETRDRVSDAVERVARLVGRTGVVGLLLSQTSRAASRQLASGERIGADAADAGAETAAIERWSAAVITIGTIGEPAEDGSRAAELSIAAARYEAGDRVAPARVDLRTGRWRLAGDARPAADVRADRRAQRDRTRATTAALAIEQLLVRSDTPLSATEIRERISGTRDVVCAAVRELVRAGRLVRVRMRRRGGQWPVWTPDRARQAGMSVDGAGEP